MLNRNNLLSVMIVLFITAALSADVTPVGSDYIPPQGATLIFEEYYGSDPNGSGQGSWLSDNGAITVQNDHIIIDTVNGAKSAYLNLPFAIHTAHTIDIGLLAWNTGNADDIWAGTWQFTSYPGWGSGLKYKYVFQNNDGGIVTGQRNRTGQPETSLPLPENIFTVVRQTLDAAQYMLVGSNTTLSQADDDWNGGTGSPRWSVFSEPSGAAAQFKIAWVKMYSAGDAQPPLQETASQLPVPDTTAYRVPETAVLVFEERYGSDYQGTGSWIEVGNSITEQTDSFTLATQSGQNAYLDLGSLSLRNVESIIDIGIKKWSTTDAPGKYSAVIRLNDGYGSGLRNEWICQAATGIYNGRMYGRVSPSSQIPLPQNEMSVIRLTGTYTTAAALRNFYPETATTGYEWNGGAGVNKLQIHSEGTGSNSQWEIAWLRIYINADPQTDYAAPLQALYCGGPGTEYKLGDISGSQGYPDCYVDLMDFAAMTQDWGLSTDPCDPDSAANLTYQYQDLPLDGGGAVQAVAGSPHDTNLVLAAVDVSGIARSTDAGQSWTMVNQGLNSHFDHAVADVAFSPAASHLAFAATGKTWGNGSYSGSFKVSFDAGQTWNDTPLEMSFGGQYGLRQYGNIILPHTTDPCTVIVGTGEQGIMKTTDLGQTWQAVGPADIASVMVVTSINGNDNNLLIGAALHNATYVSTGTLNGIWKSTDAGQTWTHVYTTDNIYDIAVASNGEIIAVGQDSVLRSTNAGSSWTAFDAGLPSDGATTYRWNCAAADPLNPGRFIIAAMTSPSAFSHPKLYARSPGASTWFAIDADVASIYTPYGVPGTDGWQGYTTWLAATPSCVNYHPNTSRAYLTDWYTVNVSTDSGQTWAAKNQGLRTTVPYYAQWDRNDPTHLYLGTADVGIFEATVTDTPVSVQSLRDDMPGSDAAIAQFAAPNGDIITLICMDSKYIYRSVNGSPFSLTYSYANNCGGSNVDRGFARFAVKDNSATLFASLSNGMILQSLDAGLTFSCYADSLVTNAQQVAGNVSAVSYKTGQNQWHVTVSGTDFTAVTPGSWSTTDTADYVYTADASAVYRVTAGALNRRVIERSLDNGATWQQVFDTTAYTTNNGYARVVTTADPDVVYTYWYNDYARSGIAVTTNAGDTWTTLPTPPGYSAMGLHPDPQDPQRFILRTHGLAFWLASLE